MSHVNECFEFQCSVCQALLVEIEDGKNYSDAVESINKLEEDALLRELDGESDEERQIRFRRDY